MRLTSTTIKNFKGIDKLELSLDPYLNVLIGDNGSGKTAILEALTIAGGTLFVGIKNVSARTIRKSDVRYTSFQEYAYPVSIQSEGELEGRPYSWKRGKNSQRGGTTTKESNSLIEAGKSMGLSVREGAPVNLPLISYFSTSRLFVEARSKNSLPSNGNGKGARKLLQRLSDQPRCSFQFSPFPTLVRVQRA